LDKFHPIKPLSDLTKYGGGFFLILFAFGFFYKSTLIGIIYSALIILIIISYLHYKKKASLIEYIPFGNHSLDIGEIIEIFFTRRKEKPIRSSDVCIYVGDNGIDLFRGPQLQKGKKTLLFEKVDELYFSSEHLIINGVDQGINFRFSWNRRKSDNTIPILFFCGKYKEGKWFRDSGEIYLKAGLLAETVWTAHLAKRLSHICQNHKPIRFYVQSDPINHLKPIQWIEVSPTMFKVYRIGPNLLGSPIISKIKNERSYKRDEITSIVSENGVMKFIFHSNKTTKYQFKKTESVQIQLGALSNSMFFQRLLEYYGYTKSSSD
jgi:hypothetical protein